MDEKSHTFDFSFMLFQTIGHARSVKWFSAIANSGAYVRNIVALRRRRCFSKSAVVIVILNESVADLSFN